jgi:hypothetical protein
MAESGPLDWSFLHCCTRLLGNTPLLRHHLDLTLASKEITRLVKRGSSGARERWDQLRASAIRGESGPVELKNPGEWS